MEEKEALNKAFEEIMHNFPYLPREAIIEVELQLLESMGLTGEGDFLNMRSDFDHSFRVIESQNRITLYNQQFVIWIIPAILEGIPATYALIGIREEGGARLEIVFLAKGTYNSSRLVLRLLERYLNEIQETEELISKMEEKS